MNARCYGGEISQVVSKVTTVSLDGEIKHYDKNDKVFVVIKTHYLWIMAI